MNIFRLAWQFIRYDRAKSIGIIIGIIISTFLIGQQLGIFTFLTRLMGSIVSNSPASIWVVDNKTLDINQVGRFDIRFLTEIRSLPYVRTASPVLFSGARAVMPDGNTVNILLIGSDPPKFPVGPRPESIVEGTLDNLISDGSVSVDDADKELFGSGVRVGQRFEINGKEARVGIRTLNLRGFGSAQVFTTIDRVRFYANLPATTVTAILVEPVSPEYRETVIDEINSRFPTLHAWSRESLTLSSILEILGSSGIASSTGTLIIFALITGVLIIGLTMYSSVLDRLKDYGTMKAIGATNRFLGKLLLAQAVIFATSGFIMAWCLLEIFRFSVVSTGLVIQYRWWEIAGIFIITSTISAGGMLFALFRLRKVEPASVFRS